MAAFLALNQAGPSSSLGGGTMYDTTKPYKNDILNSIKQTWNSPYVKAIAGNFPITQSNGLEIDHSDGIGTKGLGWWQYWKKYNAKPWRGIVQDALAMNLNDLLVSRAKPYKLQNHIIICEDNSIAIKSLVDELVSQCIKRNIVITGGETSVMDTIQGIDLSITMTGIAEYKEPKYDDGDILIGLPSSGIHANGFTAIRKYCPNDWLDTMIPTEIYSDYDLNLDVIKAMWNVTGGGYSRLKVDGYDLFIEDMASHHHIFRKMFHAVGDEIYSIFNCGTGFVFSVDPKDMHLFNFPRIGRIRKGSGSVFVRSGFSGRQIQI